MNTNSRMVKGAFFVLLLVAVVALWYGCESTPALKRTEVNPWNWGAQFRMNQGEVIEGGSRMLVMSGQTALDAEAKPMHAGDLRAQWNLAFDNLEAVLAEAGMDLSNVVQIVIYTTDVAQTLANWDLYVERIDKGGVKPPQSLIGVAELAFPELMIEMEATAIQ